MTKQKKNESNPFDEFWGPIIDRAYQIMKDLGMIKDEEIKKTKKDN